MSFDWAAFFEYMPRLIRAAGVTLQVSLLSLGLACLLAPVLSLARLLGPAPLRALTQAFIEVVRGLPPLVVIAFCYFALPKIGLVLSAFRCGVLALGVVGAVYAAEIIRAAIESLGKGQLEAALALGFSRWRAVMEILLPQALRRILPPLTNEFANLIKASSLLSVISVHEISQVGQSLIFETFVVIEILVQMAVLYLIIIGGLSFLSRRMERRLAA
jgi:polar amino acid transport system permease protein